MASVNFYHLYKLSLLKLLFRGINVFQVAYILGLNVVLLLGAIYWVLFWAVQKVGPVFRGILWCIGIIGLLGGLMMALGVGTTYINDSVGGDGLLLAFLRIFYFIGILFAHTIAMDQIRMSTGIFNTMGIIGGTRLLRSMEAHRLSRIKAGAAVEETQ